MPERYVGGGGHGMPIVPMSRHQRLAGNLPAAVDQHRVAGKRKARRRHATWIHQDEMDFGFVVAEHADVLDVRVSALIRREALPDELQR
jgi:hypothetical protein